MAHTTCDDTRHCTEQRADGTRNNAHDNARVNATTRTTARELARLRARHAQDDERTTRGDLTPNNTT
jgi:hypothetical protein